MDLNFLEYKKTKKWDKDEDKEVEIEERVLVPFETHPCELVSSMTKRYVEFRVKELRMPLPPPDVIFFLRRETDGATIPPETTVNELVKKGTVLVEIGARVGMRYAARR